tara:strand:+ start:229 stop:654 length:426 start_codon:yes stop_codon:yes gene_type:complete
MNKIQNYNEWCHILQDLMMNRKECLTNIHDEIRTFKNKFCNDLLEDLLYILHPQNTTYPTKNKKEKIIRAMIVFNGMVDLLELKNKESIPNKEAFLYLLQYIIGNASSTKEALDNFTKYPTFTHLYRTLPSSVLLNLDLLC